MHRPQTIFRLLPVAVGIGMLLSWAPAPAMGREDESQTKIEIGTTFALNSTVLRTARNVNVCLPLSYESSEENFPVVYLIDGGVQQDLLPVAGFGALATLSGQYEEFILVGVETLNRRYELTTPSKEPYDLSVIPTNGGAGNFRRFLVNEVQPFVDARFRTSGETAVLGESLAGLFIVDTFLHEPKSFDHYIAVSPSVWWKGGALARASADLLTAPGFPDACSLYLTVADEIDIKTPLAQIVSALEDHAPTGLTWWYEPLPTEHHNTIYHPATLDALRRIFAPE